MSVVKNGKVTAQRFFGMHMHPGTAGYKEPGKDPYIIFLNEETIKGMDKTFSGKPVYVNHVDNVDLTKTDGVVVKSFFNPSDGKHWVEFMIDTEEGMQAISNGWKLSNAYLPTESTVGGMCNGVDYDHEILKAEYEHLAIVSNPRYEESIIMTPERFKDYNAKKELELSMLMNSKTKGDSMLNFFKRAKVENSADMEGVSVTLPKSKKEMTIVDLVAFADSVHNMNGYANGDHMVKIGEDEMSVNDLAAAYGKMKEDVAKNAAEPEKKEEEPKKNEEESEEDKKKKENEEKEKAEKKENGLKHFNALKEAEMEPIKNSSEPELMHDRVQRGKDRYGA